MRIAGWFVLSAVCFALAWLPTVACGPALPSPADEVTVGAYGAALDTCVATASTLAESKACRCKVNETYGRPCQ